MATTFTVTGPSRAKLVEALAASGFTFLIPVGSGTISWGADQASESGGQLWLRHSGYSCGAITPDPQSDYDAVSLSFRNGHVTFGLFQEVLERLETMGAL